MAVSHVKSNTIADWTGTVTIGNSTGGTQTINATDLVRPGDWNSAHNQFYTLSGNTTNASTASGTNVVFQGAGGITLGGSTGTIVISGANEGTLYVYPVGPVPLASSSFVSGTSGGTGGSTQFTVSGYVSPMYLDGPLVYDEVEMLISGQATVAGTGSASNGWMVGLYSVTGSTLSLITSHQFVHYMSQNSATAQTHNWFWGTDSNTNSSASNGNISASYSDLRQVNLYEGGTNGTVSIPQGTIYQVVVHTARTSSVNLGGYSSAMCQSWSQTTGASYFGRAVYSAPIDERFHGVFSTTLNASNSHVMSLPNSINQTAITNTGGSSQVRIPHVRYYT